MNDISANELNAAIHTAIDDVCKEKKEAFESAVNSLPVKNRKIFKAIVTLVEEGYLLVMSHKYEGGFVVIKSPY